MLFGGIKKFDGFPKMDLALTKQTHSGGIVTLIIICTMLFLFFSELHQYRTLKYKYEFLIDTEIKQLMLVNMDITVAMKCDYIRADIIDIAGTSLPIKIETSPAAYYTEGALDLSIRLDQETLEKNQNRPLKDDSWHLWMSSRNTGPLVACRVHGSFHINKLQGSFHITAKGHGYSGGHVPHDAINFTHRIDELSFGEHYPGLINPLDNTHLKAESHFDNFQYFLGIVPTIYIDQAATFFEGILVTNQYAVTEFNHAIDPNNPDKIPGIFLKYNLEPLAVRVTQYRGALVDFITRTCGIIGGVFVTSGMVLRFFMMIKNMVSSQT